MGSRAHVKVVRDQFSDKHKQMAKDPIRFLRGFFIAGLKLGPRSARI